MSSQTPAKSGNAPVLSYQDILRLRTH